jgi:uncharacterized protein (DUF302 family)
MLRFLFTCLLVISTSLPLFAADGLIDVKSAYNVQQTADRLETILHEKGMTVFNRIKHSESAQAIGIKIKNTELIIFGNPKVGSPLMLCQQTVAIDLPQKALIWEDASGTVRITYNDPGYLQKRHNIQGCDALLAKISKVLSGITQAAAKRN